MCISQLLAGGGGVETHQRQMYITSSVSVVQGCISSYEGFVLYQYTSPAPQNREESVAVRAVASKHPSVSACCYLNPLILQLDHVKYVNGVCEATLTCSKPV